MSEKVDVARTVQNAFHAQFSIHLDLCKNRMSEIREWQRMMYMIHPENCLLVVETFGEAISQAVEHLQLHGVDEEKIPQCSGIIAKLSNLSTCCGTIDYKEKSHRSCAVAWARKSNCGGCYRV